MDDRGDDVAVRRDENIPGNYAAENYVAENYVAEVCENLCPNRGDAESMAAEHDPSQPDAICRSPPLPPGTVRRCQSSSPP